MDTDTSGGSEIKARSMPSESMASSYMPTPREVSSS